MKSRLLCISSAGLDSIRLPSSGNVPGHAYPIYAVRQCRWNDRADAKWNSRFPVSTLYLIREVASQVESAAPMTSEAQAAAGSGVLALAAGQELSGESVNAVCSVTENHCRYSRFPRRMCGRTRCEPIT